MSTGKDSPTTSPVKNEPGPAPGPGVSTKSEPQHNGHSFLSGISEVKNMEDSLLSLLNSFHSGELSAFGRGKSLETMEAIRAKQEKLAKLHFDLGTTKQGESTGSHQQNWLSEPDQNQLVAGLRELSVEIEKLHEKHH